MRAILINLIQIHYQLLNSIIDLFQRTLFNIPPGNCKKVLIIRKGNLGDLVCSIDAFNSIKKHFSDAKLYLLTTSGSISIIGADQILPKGFFDEIIDFKKHSPLQLFQKLRIEQFDTVIELPADVDTLRNQIRNMCYFRLVGIINGGGWGITRTNFLQHTQATKMSFDNEQTRLFKLLSKMGIVPSKDGAYHFFNEEDLLHVKSIIGNNIHSKKTIAVATGAKLSKKQWPMEYVKEVIEHFIHKGYSVIAIGDINDKTEIEKLQVSGLINMCGMLTISQSSALLSLCSICICNDSGPMHLSYSVGTPVVAIFSARNYPGKWFPPDDGKNKVLGHFEVNCSGCMNKQCFNNICMQLVRPIEVINMIEKIV